MGQKGMAYPCRRSRGRYVIWRNLNKSTALLMLLSGSIALYRFLGVTP